MDRNEQSRFGDEPQHKGRKQWFGRTETRKGPGNLNQKVRDGFEGVFNWDEIPDECINFIVDQLIRAGMPMSSKLMKIPYSSALQAIHYVNMADPYCLFTRGLTDVDLTDEWGTTEIEMYRKVGNGERSIGYPVDPQRVDCYKLNVPQCESVFRHLMGEPYLGLEAAIKGGFNSPGGSHFLHDIAWALTDHTRKKLLNVRVEDVLGSRIAYQELSDFCSFTIKGGGRSTPDTARMELYFEFSAWAAFVWLISPLSREWRFDHGEIFRYVLDDGEAIMIDYTLYKRGMYKKTGKPVQACDRCGVQAWCLTSQMRGERYVKICEHCTSRGLPPAPPENCGLRLCRMAQCKHHPSFRIDPNRRLHETMRKTGQLMAKIGLNAQLDTKIRDQNLLT